ncbi:MAG: hypothetical protein J6L73_02005 [Muribaculaceae bacterium]|nr:hypothetical protein [Muribaculaceae bacterium]
MNRLRKTKAAVIMAVAVMSVCAVAQQPRRESCGVTHDGFYIGQNNQAVKCITLDGVIRALVPWYAETNTMQDDLPGFNMIGTRFTPELEDELEAEAIVDRDIAKWYLETKGRIPKCVALLKKWIRYCFGYRNENNERILRMCYVDSIHAIYALDDLNLYPRPRGLDYVIDDPNEDGMRGIDVQINMHTKRIESIKHL